MKNKSRKKKGAVPKINPLKVLTSIPGLIKRSYRNYSDRSDRTFCYKKRILFFSS